jgi:hypothetical protein
VGRPLWREVGSVFCMCCWPLPAQSFSGPSPLGLETIFYCLTFETSLFVAFYDSQGHGGGIRSRLHTGMNWTEWNWSLYKLATDHPQKTHQLLSNGYHVLLSGVFTHAWPSNGRPILRICCCDMCLQDYCLAMLWVYPLQYNQHRCAYSGFCFRHR